MHQLALRTAFHGKHRAEDAFDALVRTYHSSDNPVVIIAVAVAIVLGLGFIVYLTAQCIARGYRGFGGVVNIDWKSPFSANVKFECFK